MNEVLVSLISAIGGAIAAYITHVAAKRVQSKKEKQGPVDRMEQMFDGYERLIRQKDMEDEKKATLIDELEEEIKLTRQMIKNLEYSLAVSQHELKMSRKENKELSDALNSMRNEYEKNKLLEQETSNGE